MKSTPELLLLPSLTAVASNSDIRGVRDLPGITQETDNNGKGGQGWNVDSAPWTRAGGRVGDSLVMLPGSGLGQIQPGGSLWGTGQKSMSTDDEEKIRRDEKRYEGAPKISNVDRMESLNFGGRMPRSRTKTNKRDTD